MIDPVVLVAVAIVVSSLPFFALFLAYCRLKRELVLLEEQNEALKRMLRSRVNG